MKVIVPVAPGAETPALNVTASPTLMLSGFVHSGDAAMLTTDVAVDAALMVKLSVFEVLEEFLESPL